jgi:tol-pal system protein YbgF
MASVAEDGWVAVGQVPTAKPAVESAKPAYNTSQPVVSASTVRASTVTTPATTLGISPNNTFSTTSVSPVASNSSLQLELLGMVETMQQEIAELRGMVEEQNHKVEMLETQQQQRYLDLDKRVSELYKAPQGSKTTQLPNSALTSLPASQKAALPADDLYASAMSSVKKKDFATALSQFDLLAKTYPKHALAANAYYWSGEVNLTDGNFDAAIKQFQTVIDGYPKHNKAADSHYKLAVALDRIGKTAKSKEVLNQVISQYKGVSDSAVRLAERYLKRLEANP